MNTNLTPILVNTNKSDYTGVLQSKKTEKLNTEISDKAKLNITDKKNITEDSTKPIKTTPLGFVEDKTHHNLEKHKAVSTISKVIVPELTAKVATKTVVTAIGKTTSKTATKTVAESFGKALTKSIVENTVQTVVTSGAEVATLKVMEKTAEKAAKKGGTELSKRVSGAVPVVGTVMEVGFTLWDAKYAYDLTKDKKATTISKAFAWATVGLDVVSAVTVATGVGSPIGWAATGLSIGTAVLSDMLKYKN